MTRAVPALCTGSVSKNSGLHQRHVRMTPFFTIVSISFIQFHGYTGPNLPAEIFILRPLKFRLPPLHFEPRCHGLVPLC